MDTADEDLYGHLRDNVPLNECPQQLDDDINVSQLLLGTGSYSSVCLAHRTLVEDQEVGSAECLLIWACDCTASGPSRQCPRLLPAPATPCVAVSISQLQVARKA